MAWPLFDQDAFVIFLLEAKRATYASSGDAANVPAALPGAKQLEYRVGPFLYRDVYYGAELFVGQETVYHDDAPVWSMGYAGWMLDDTVPLGGFLKEAMRLVSADRPFRGPSHHRNGDYVYTDEGHGTVDRFWGHEVISYQGRPIYELRYQGGLLR